MRILVISQYFWPENFRVNDLCLELKNRGHQITVLTGLPNYPSGKFYKGYKFFNNKNEIWNGIKIYRTKLVPRHSGSPFFLILNYLSFALFSTLKIFLIKEKFDNIIVYQLSPGTVGFPAIAARIKYKAPLSFYIQDIWPESLSDAGGISSKNLLKLIDKMMNIFYKYSDQIIVQSEGFINFLVTKGVPRNKLVYIPNTVESFYKPVEILKEYKNQMPDGFNLLFAGNIGVAQDFESIINAAEILKKKGLKINWVIIGDGRAKDLAVKKIFNLNLTSSFYFLGSKKSNEMPYYFTCADILLVSLKKSTIFSLTIPSKIQSYLACRKPIIANIDGIGASIINDSNAGLSSPSGNYINLAHNIEIIYNKSIPEREQLGLNGYNYYLKHYERKIIYDKLEKILTF